MFISPRCTVKPISHNALDQNPICFAALGSVNTEQYRCLDPPRPAFKFECEYRTGSMSQRLSAFSVCCSSDLANQPFVASVANLLISEHERDVKPVIIR